MLRIIHSVIEPSVENRLKLINALTLLIRFWMMFLYGINFKKKWKFVKFDTFEQFLMMVKTILFKFLMTDMMRYSKKFLYEMSVLPVTHTNIKIGYKLTVTVNFDT